MLCDSCWACGHARRTIAVVRSVGMPSAERVPARRVWRRGGAEKRSVGGARCVVGGCTAVLGAGPLNSCLVRCALGWGPGTQIVSCKFQYGRVLNRLQGRVARSAAGVSGALLPTHSSAATRSLSPTAISLRRCGVSAPPHYRSHIRPQQRRAAAGLQTPTSTGCEKG